MNKPFGHYKIQDAVDLWADGYDTAQIAAYFGCSESYIYNRITEWRRDFKPTDLRFAA